LNAALAAAPCFARLERVSGPLAEPSADDDDAVGRASIVVLTGRLGRFKRRLHLVSSWWLEPFASIAGCPAGPKTKGPSEEDIPGGPIAF
jgi:hypothetical protein